MSHTVNRFCPGDLVDVEIGWRISNVNNDTVRARALGSIIGRALLVIAVTHDNEHLLVMSEIGPLWVKNDGLYGVQGAVQVSYGDPFDALYKDVDLDITSARRRKLLVERGLVPGTMIVYGPKAPYVDLRSKDPIYAWTAPDFKSDGFNVPGGHGLIMAVDCSSDPVNDWLMLFVNADGRRLFCWLPTGLVEVVK